MRSGIALSDGEQTWRKLLTVPTLTFTKAVEKAVAMETVEDSQDFSMGEDASFKLTRPRGTETKEVFLQLLFANHVH